MKRLSLVVFAFYFIACNQPQEMSDVSAMGLAELPANATKEPYESNPDLVKVTYTDPDGIVNTGDYLLGERTGTWTEFHPNGLVKSVTGYVAGIKQGSYTEIDDRGQLTIAANYHSGQLHGEWIKYNRARVKEEKNYVNGKLEGISKMFYDTGAIMEEGNYANGVRDGVSKWYDQEGNVTIEYEYSNGELVNK
ncbi:toxin-antitoxin system YwqK family antitoxin [Fulvivirga lutea]|uniref:Toxin-antitoxin system YwqK family antitoxin n=1 Tax=Fulvivirga lutea TaxID=2810512 RepID=A0A974WLA6_9BACT|nr:toxin-antitoxin system YwqK family antitoxin [Fulvivirga lutea]QSE99322.1 toxin-antitoxin system YwqK family antitoxin [Fulvivirga lutea]